MRLQTGAVLVVIFRDQLLYARGEIAARRHGERFVGQKGEHLLLGEVCHEQIRRDALGNIGLRRGDEHDLFACQAFTRGRDGHRVHQRLTRAAADEVDLKAAAPSGEEIGRMRADFRGFQLT